MGPPGDHFLWNLSAVLSSDGTVSPRSSWGSGRIGPHLTSSLNPGPSYKGRVRGVVREVPREYRRRLRRDQTTAELKLWFQLRDRRLSGAKFRRQHPIGPYIADFCCFEAKLIIELDGGQHALRARADSVRTAFLESRGYRVLRFWDNDVLTNLAGVLQRIAESLKNPHPNPLPEGEGTSRLQRG